MKPTYPLCVLTLLAGSASAAIQTWEWSGTLNLVTSPLSGQFSTGQSFTVRMHVDTAAAQIYSGRADYYTSSGSYNPVVSATVTVNDWYSANFWSGSNPSNITASVTNAEESASFYYDQLLMSFFSYQGIIDAPDVNTGTETFTVNSIEFNLYGPPNMIVGNGATFPTVDAPLPIPGINFFPELNSNGPYNFIIRFQEGGGVNMLRGTFTNFAVVPEPGHLTALLALGAGAVVCWRRRQRKRI